MSPIKNTPGKGIEVVTNYADHVVNNEDKGYREAAYKFNTQQPQETTEAPKQRRMKKTTSPSKPEAKTRQIERGKACRDLAAERDKKLKQAAAKDLKSRNIKSN